MRWLGVWFIALVSCAHPSRGELFDRQHAALKRGDVLEAVRLGRARVALSPTDIGARYDLACALARAADAPAALVALKEAVALGYDDAGWIERDEDLASLRGRPELAALVAEAARIGRDGIDVPQVRTIVRDDVPMPVRLRLPREGRARLAVWLHPRGARLNADVERLAPVFLSFGWALAVPTRPRLAGWNDEDLRALLDQTVPALADAVDVEHPLLIGLSAGAQAALVAWTVAPTRYSAVIAGAVSTDTLGHALPAGGAPVVIVNGADDPALASWRAELASWQREGRRVSLRVVPNRGHEMLFDEATLREALQDAAR